MSDLTTSTRESWSSDLEPTQLSMPIQGRDLMIDRLEEQFDQLLDLLAADRMLDEPEMARPAVAHSSTSRSALTEFSAQPECEQLELSIVMPCLNEAETVGNCVLKAQYALD